MKQYPIVLKKVFLGKEDDRDSCCAQFVTMFKCITIKWAQEKIVYDALLRSLSKGEQYGFMRARQNHGPLGWLRIQVAFSRDEIQYDNSHKLQVCG